MTDQTHEAPTFDLELRQTNRYVGSYQRLDDWQHLGTGKILTTEQLDIDADPEDATDPQTVVHVVAVDAPAWGRSVVMDALGDSFTNAGCAHDYDCCGCRSHYASAEALEDGRYRVTVRSSRNY